ncbi:MAG: serine/threonine protein kinase/tetratricopeptide (TPR) repeat protein [Planctomycetota bacterium]|jgi:serine/threonine protein kinase/tetratricopeptide (TPR) repeat protein
MDPTRYRLIKDVFAQTRQLEGDEREQFLNERCGADQDLRNEVEQLIASDEDAKGGALDRALSSDRAETMAPTRIGNYELQRQIGEGGMGEVFVAEQIEPMRRTVAIKIIRQGLENKSVLARFESERQALAMMEHQNIARAFDAGTMDDGRPYFVMEYVRGVPITEYCDNNRLTTAERLELLAQVCDGIHHAHQKAIIHRDIKPSNVLVTVQDGVPVPKIIDFGIAKAAGKALTERTLFTELGQVIGTPEYMSPEQAELNGNNVDTRTDIYSIGVLMYEVLLGVLPFDPSELRKAGFDEILRRIREVDPQRPSTRLIAMGDTSTETLARRRTTSHRLVSLLKGDLDWITMKALEKDRTRRYRSATELADDIRRFLRHETVSAGPPGAAYVVSKFVRRHRIGVAFWSAACVMLVAFAVTTTVQAKQIAVERDRANEEATSARRITDFLIGLFKKADPERSKGAEVTAKDILDAGAREIAAFNDEPRAQASFMEAIGHVYTVMGLLKEGRELLEQALEIRLEADDGEERSQLALASVHYELGTIYLRLGMREESLEMVRSSLATRKRLLGDHSDVAACLIALGNGLNMSGDTEGAFEAHRGALAIQEDLYGPDDSRIATTLHNIGSLYFMTDELDKAVEHYERSIEIKIKSDPVPGSGVATSMHTLAMVYLELGRFSEARPLEEKSLEIRERVLGPDHWHVALSLTTLARILVAVEEADGAIPFAARAVQIGRVQLGSGHADVMWMERAQVAALNAAGRHEDALELMEPLVKRAEESDHKAELWLHLAELGATLLALEQFDDAEAAHRRSIEVSVEKNGDDSARTAKCRMGLARVLRDTGNSEAAKESFREAIRVLEDARAADDPDLVLARKELSEIL